MFGYVKTDMPNMYVKDTTLYKAMYCGLCKGIGKTCGQKARLVLNYDLTFLSTLAHNVMDSDVKIEKQRCIIHQIVKRPVAVPDAITYRVAILNVILAYHKLNDDVIDSGKGKLKRSMIMSAYKKAKKKEPVLDKIVEKNYDALLKLEREKCDSVDIASDPFGNMMVELISEIVGSFCTEELKKLAYNLGKWIYLIDALDDFDKDKKKNNFNVFINAYPDVNDKNQLIMSKREDLNFIFGSVLSTISNCSNSIDYKFNHDLIDNILNRGLIKQTKQTMENCTCKNTTKS